VPKSFVVGLLLSPPGFVRAQGASINSRIVDQTGGVLPVKTSGVEETITVTGAAPLINVTR